jgi:hypothetical protein
MHKFSLDTNCVIAVEECREEASAIRRLSDAHAAGNADVAVIAMSASENQKPGHTVKNFSEFKERLTALGLDHLNIVLPMGYWGISFWDYALWTDEAMVNLEREIHSILCPTVQFFWADYCRDHNIIPPPESSFGKWRNWKCDVQAMWSHIHHKRDVFVTSDSNFHKNTVRAGLVALGANAIEYPKGAAALL